MSLGESRPKVDLARRILRRVPLQMVCDSNQDQDLLGGRATYQNIDTEFSIVSPDGRGTTEQRSFNLRKMVRTAYRGLGGTAGRGLGGARTSSFTSSTGRTTVAWLLSFDWVLSVLSFR